MKKIEINKRLPRTCVFLVVTLLYSGVGSCGRDVVNETDADDLDASKPESIDDATIDSYFADVASRNNRDSSTNGDSSNQINDSCLQGTYREEKAWLTSLDLYCSYWGCPGGGLERTETDLCAMRWRFMEQRVIYGDCELRGVSYRWGESMGEYFFDTISDELVGAVYQDDVPMDCKGSGVSHDVYTMVGGRTAEDEACVVISRIDLCPSDDAGVDDAGD